MVDEIILTKFYVDLPLISFSVEFPVHVRIHLLTKMADTEYVPVFFFVSVNLTFLVLYGKSKILIKTVQHDYILIAFLAALTHLMISNRV